MREQEVTLTVEKILRDLGFEILSLNNPFAGKSVSIKPQGGYRGKGTLIPDIIARLDKIYLVIESCNKLKIKDIEKLNKYALPEYKETIKKIFEEDKIILVKVMAYPEPVKNYEYPTDFMVVGINKDFSVNMYLGNDNFLKTDKRKILPKNILSNKNIFYEKNK